MTNAVLSGKSDAGNPHVRFDEGEVASAEPRRGALLYTKLASMAAAVVPVLAFADACDEILAETVPQTPEVASYRQIGDSFTVGRGGRTDGYYQNLPNAADLTTLKEDAGYHVETAPYSMQWMPPRNGSFNTPSTAVSEYAGNNTGNAGASTGFLQNGGGLIAVPCPQGGRVTYQMDARWHTTKCDYVAIGYFSSEFPTLVTGYLVSFHKDGSVKVIRQNAAAVDTGLRTGVVDPNAAWHNFAVTFDFVEQTLDVYVDRTLLGRVQAADLNSPFLSAHQMIGMGCSGYVAWFDNVQIGSPASSQVGLGLNVNEGAEVTAGTFAAVMNDGRIVKSGTGEAIVRAPAGSGECRVDGGHVTIAGGVPELPESQREGLVFWVDANRNVEASEGNLTWCDVREKMAGTLYPRACTFESAEVAPTVQTDGQGRKWIDFGVYNGDGASWLQWRDGLGNVQALTPQTVFYVAACPNGGGRFLTNYDGGEAVGATCWSPTETAGMATSALVGDPLFGATWKSGVFSGSGTGTSLAASGCVYVLRKSTAYETATAVASFDNLKGGGRLGEVLVYSSRLSDEQVLAVSHYLQQKWCGAASLGRIEDVSGSGVTLASDASNPIVIGRDDGHALVSLSGSGMVKMSPGAHPVVLEKGKVYVSDANGVTVADGDASSVSVSGNGVVATTALSADVPVTLASGELRLTGSPTASVSENLISNGSFETYERFAATDPASMFYGYNSTLPGWTVSGSAGIASHRATVAFLPERAPEGEFAAFVQSGTTSGVIEQSFQVGTAGNYELSFATGYRIAKATPFFQVLVDNEALCTIHVINKTFKRCRIFVPNLSVGTHTLRFVAVDKGEDALAVIDDVILRRARNSNANLIGDGSFESALLNTLESGTGTYYDYDPSGTGWTFVDPDNSSVKNAGVSDMCGVWGLQAAPDGGKFAFLRQNGYLGRDIAFTEAGTYRLSFKVAGRVYYNSDGRAYWAAPQNYRIKFGETVVADLVADRAEFAEYTVRLPAVTTPGETVRLSFVGTSDTSKDVAAVFDDVRVERETSFLENPGFESLIADQYKYNPVGEGWTFTGLSGVARRNSTFNCAVVEPEGVWSAFLQQDGRISQIVTPSRSGCHRIRFSAAWRGKGDKNHSFRVLCGGMLLGEVNTGSNAAFSDYSFRTPSLKAGTPVEIAFVGIKPPDDRTSILDNVSMIWESEAGAFDATAFKGASLELSAGAKLGLDFDGRIELDSLKIGTRQRRGLLSAENTDFIVGTGSVFVEPLGMAVIVR